MSRKRNAAGRPKADSATTKAEAFASGARASLWRQWLGEPFAIGIAALLLLRPYIDGIVYPFWNIPFLWGQIALFIAWALHSLATGRRVRFGVPALLLFGFLAVACATFPATAQYDQTYRTLPLWFGYFFLFVVASNAVGPRYGFAIVMGGLLLTELLEAMFSVMHFRYILPLTRMQLSANPDMVRWSTDIEATDSDFSDRLYTNRAFGTFLFPNALAGFLILALPYVLFGVFRSVHALKEALATRQFDALQRPPLDGGAPELSEFPARARSRTQYAVALAAALALFLGVTAFFFNGLTRDVDFRKISWANQIAYRLLTEGLLPLGAFIATLVLVRRYTPFGFFAVFRPLAFAATLAYLGCALWLTYTRGAFLALAIALLAGAFLLRTGRRAASAHPLVSLAGAMLVLLSGALFLAADAAPAPPTEAPAAAAADAVPSEFAKAGGVDVTLSDLASGATVLLRFSYWRVGLRMALDNFLTGVGLGNYGTVYPNYKFVGAPDVQTAHNDYLQLLCETGFFGCLFFSGFWVFFAVWGFRRIRKEPHGQERWVLTGLYCSILAFVLHAGVDFNFMNVTLATPAFCLAGLFYGRAYSALPEDRGCLGTGPSQGVALLALVVGCAVAGTTTSITRSELAFRTLGEDIQKPIQAASFFLAKANREGMHEALPIVSALFDNKKQLETFGYFIAPAGDDPQRLRQLGAGERLTVQSRFVVRDIEQARTETRRAAQACIDRLKEVDRLYPHRLDLAQALANWYNLLLNTTDDREERQAFVLESVRWCAACVDRSPRQAMYHQWLGEALWNRANLEGGREGVDLLIEGIEHFKRAAELNPTWAKLWFQYAQQSRIFADTAKASNQTALARQYYETALTACQRGIDIQVEKGIFSPKRVEEVKSEMQAIREKIP